MKTFEAWEDDDGITLSDHENIIEQKKSGLISENAKLLHTIEAESYEEAMVQHHKNMGWEPYKPMG